MDEHRVQISSLRIRATIARSRAAALCRDARSLRKASESVTASILSNVGAPSFPGNIDPRRLVLRLVPLAPCVGFARRELGLWLDRNGVDRASAHEISVACGEACANAVEHPVSPSRHLFEVWGDAGADTVAIGAGLRRLGGAAPRRQRAGPRSHVDTRADGPRRGRTRRRRHVGHDVEASVDCSAVAVHDDEHQMQLGARQPPEQVAPAAREPHVAVP